MATLSHALLVILVLACWAAIVSLPGIALTCLGWNLSVRLSPVPQVVFRATVIALFLTPTIFGHAGLFPALFIVFVTTGSDKLVGIIPIVAVWIACIPVIGLVHRRRGQK